MLRNRLASSALRHHLRESSQRRLPVEDQDTETRHQQEGRKEREYSKLHNVPFRREYERSFE